MQIYLPIAEVSVNFFLIFGMGAGVGILSGLFGVGGGFLITPLLMFVGIPPAIAVATSSNLLVGSSVSGVLAHWRRGNVDFKMGGVLLIGGLAGSIIGVGVFTFLKSLGQVDLVIQLCYVFFLGGLGSLMMIESIQSIIKRKRKIRTRSHTHNWMHGLPYKIRFRRSRLYISVFLPLSIGFFVGLLSAIMGVGGGFIIVPAMVYMLGMPTAVVIGTSLFQIIFVSANITILQSTNNQSVDVVLAIILLTGAVIGAQFGAKFGAKLQGEQLRGLLALIVLLVCGRMAYELILTPDEIYTISSILKP